MAQIENQNINTAIDSNSYSLALATSSNEHIVKVWNATRNLERDSTVDIEWPEFTLHLMKVDEGAYTGTARSLKMEDSGDVILKFESKTIPEIVSALQIKELISPPAVEATEVAVPEVVAEVPVPAIEAIAIDAADIASQSDGRSINITINIQKSIDQIKDLIKSASVENSSGQRTDIAKDLCKSLQLHGYSQSDCSEIFRKSHNIYDVLDYLDPRSKAGFLHRLNGQQKAYGDTQSIAKSLNLPEKIENDGDILNVKRGFGAMVKELSKSRPAQKASQITFAFFKSRYGADGMAAIKKSLNKKAKPAILSQPFELIKSKEAQNQPDEMRPQFSNRPFAGFQHLIKK